jgi:hypothetical protein
VPPAVLVDEGRVRAIPGIGETIADIVEKLHRTEPIRRSRSPARFRPVLMLAIPTAPEVVKLHRELGTPCSANSRLPRVPTGWRR